MYTKDVRLANDIVETCPYLTGLGRANRQTYEQNNQLVFFVTSNSIRQFLYTTTDQEKNLLVGITVTSQKSDQVTNKNLTRQISI